MIHTRFTYRCGETSFSGENHFQALVWLHRITQSNLTTAKKEATTASQKKLLFLPLTNLLIHLMIPYREEVKPAFKLKVSCFKMARMMTQPLKTLKTLSD